jgi:hypothetical protein
MILSAAALWLFGPAAAARRGVSFGVGDAILLAATAFGHFGGVVKVFYLKNWLMVSPT